MPRSPGPRNDSQLGRPPGKVIPQGAICQSIQFPGLDVGLELPVPCFGVKLCEPIPQCRQFLGRKLPDLVFDAFHLTHVAPFLRLGDQEAPGRIGFIVPRRQPSWTSWQSARGESQDRLEQLTYNSAGRVAALLDPRAYARGCWL